jgi:hypothetical protein
MATTVVHLRRKNGVSLVEYDVYIGRPMYQGGWRLPGSKWANPFKVASEADREGALIKYEAHVRASPELMAALSELRGKRLGCWCRPLLSCHGDILVNLLREQDQAKVAPAPDVAETSIPGRMSSMPDDDEVWQALGLA